MVYLNDFAKFQWLGVAGLKIVVWDSSKSQASALKGILAHPTTSIGKWQAKADAEVSPAPQSSGKSL